MGRARLLPPQLRQLLPTCCGSPKHGMSNTAKIVPREIAELEIAELEIQQMVHIGSGQYFRRNDPSLVKQEGATLTGQPSSSAVPASSVEPLPTITKREIMDHNVFRAPSRPERQRDVKMDQDFEDIITCRCKDDHVVTWLLRCWGLPATWTIAPRKGRPERTSTTTVQISSPRSRTLPSMSATTKRDSSA